MKDYMSTDIYENAKNFYEKKSGQDYDDLSNYQKRNMETLYKQYQQGYSYRTRGNWDDDMMF